MTGQRRNPIDDSQELSDDSQEPVDLFRSIRTKLAQRANGGQTDDVAFAVLPVDAGVLKDPAEILEAPAAVARLRAGDVLRGRYVIEGQLGSGGMASVYKALDRSRSGHVEATAQVAIKVLNEQTRGRPDVLSKLRREFYCAQTLAHPSVIKVYELDLQQDLPFFTMELVEGEILAKVTQKFYPQAVPRDYAWAVIREVGAGLAHAHDRRVLHGDVKPQNVMVTNSGEVRIIDFGKSGDSSSASTPAYASCELLEGRELDPRDDLFALACLSYELLAGEHPFQQRRSTDARTSKMTLRRPTGLSRRQWKALTAGLAWDRDNRPRSVREWLAALNIGNDPLGPVPSRPDAHAPPFLKSKLSYTLIAATALALICGITWAVLSRPTLPAAVIAAADVSNTTVSEPLNAESAVANALAEELEAPAAAAPTKADKSRAAGALSAARVIDKTERISVESAAYSIRPGGKFAEVRVRRSLGSKDTTSFEWWTEPGTALADTDFAPQPPTTIFFPAGKRAVSVFIKLLPNAARKHTDVFYVVLANPSTGTALGAVSKTAITLHP
jgi:serine/threonine protein kinase